MYIHIHIFQQEGEIMKAMKDLALMSLGAGAVLAYQKYSKPIMKKMNKLMDSKMKQIDDALENMM